MPIGAATGLVLVVEDEPLVRLMAVTEFESRGWQTLGSPSAEHALSLLDGHLIDALFTDINLDGSMDGWALARHLRERIPGLVVVYTSGRTNDNAERVENSRFFDKPYVPADIVNACAELLNDVPRKTGA